MTRGCLLGVVFFGAIVGVYYIVLTPHLEWPGNAIAAGLGGLFAAMFVAGIFGIVKAYRDARRLSGTRAVGTFQDGEMVAIAGTIRPIDAPIEAPFSGMPCVAYDYDVTHIAYRTNTTSSTHSTETYEQHDISGLALTPSIIDTPTGGVRLLSFAMLDQFPQQLQNGLGARTRAADFIARTTFKPMGVTKVFSAFNALSEALTDEDGAVRMDWRMNQGEIKLENATIRERVVTVGQQVSAVGKYSAERRGLLAEGMTTLIQLRPGDAASAKRAVLGNAWTGLAFSTLFFVVSHGVIGAMVYMSETRYQRVAPEEQESALRQAVQDQDLAKLRQVIARGASPNVRDSDGLTVLHTARDGETVRVLIKGGADPNVAEKGGYTPLMMAARSGQRDVVAALLEGGARVNAARTDGGTALTDAIENEHEEIAALLRAHGGTSDLVTAENGQPLPADGGEAMEVVRANIAGIHARDEKGIAATRLPGTTDFSYTDWDGWHRLYPEKPVLLSGFSNATHATLTVGGPTIAQPPLTWHYQLVRYKGEVWRILRTWNTEHPPASAAAVAPQPVER